MQAAKQGTTGDWNSTAPRLAVGRYRFRFRAESPLEWRGYMGSAWRGALGHALKQVVCITRAEECPRCLLYHSCVYPYIFETPPPPESAKMSKYNAAPHPFALDLPLTAPPAGTRECVLGITLFGRCNRYLAYLAHALGEAGRRGIRRQRDRLALEQIEQEKPLGSGDWRVVHRQGGGLEPLGADEPAPPAPPSAVILRFETPLRLRVQDSYQGTREFEFGYFFSNLLRRISMLTYFHTETPLEAPFAELVRKARGTRAQECRFEWFDWERYSSRQNQKLRMGGLLGEFWLELRGLEDLWPYLWLGQWTHAGKGSSMGLGRYGTRPRNDRSTSL